MKRSAHLLSKVEVEAANIVNSETKLNKTINILNNNIREIAGYFNKIEENKNYLKKVFDSIGIL